MTDLERVRKVINWLIYTGVGINDNDIASQLGYTKSSFSQIINGKTPITDRFLKKLCNLDSNINIVWVKTGNGKLFLDDGSKPVSTQVDLSMRETIDALRETVSTQKELIKILHNQIQEYQSMLDEKK